MNHQINPICDECQEDVGRFKFLKKLKIDGVIKYFCSKCARERRLNFRNETIKETGIAEDLKELTRQRKNEYNKKSYIPKRYQKESQNKKVQESDAPIKIKGSEIRELNTRINTYLTMDEQQNMLKIFMSHGSTFEEAKEKIKRVKQQLIKTRENQKIDSEEEFKISKKELLKGLI